MSDAFVAIVMAAGQGTRMKSSLPKVLHRVAGRPLYAHVVDAALGAEAEKVVVVVGHGREAVRESIDTLYDERVTTAVQEQQRGTGDAARAGLTQLDGFDGWVLILSGDTPLVHRDLVSALLREARGSGMSMAMVTSEVQQPEGYGRIVRDDRGKLCKVVEHKDATDAQRTICEVNPALYAVRASFLRSALAALSDDNAQGELYLTDIAAQAAAAGGVATLTWPFEDAQGVNDRAQLADCEKAMRLRIARDLARAGVTVMDPATAYVEAGVQVAADAVLEPNVHLRGATSVAAGARIGTGCVLTDVIVDQNALLKPYTVASQSRLGPRAETGPFCHVRPDSELGEGAKLGNFVEIKKTRLGRNSKANHLAYLGDGQVGEDVNIGAGTIFCNYDGYQKHTTVLEDGVFIGSDSQLVAPVRVGRGAYVGTGTTVTRDVPENALALSRVPQENKDGYATRLKARFKTAREAAKKR